ncbi:MAG: SMC family ATPase [Anaerolineae bacterium]|nr:SMC family ATPase [Anaerolineae bacterium]
MLPIRLEMSNFLPYCAPDPIRFDGVHLACLTGPNGSGKSSLLDAITWTLWGKARARHDEDLIHQGKQDMYVQLDFEQEGLIYRVIRRRTRKQRGSGTLDLLVQDEEGTFNLISEPSIRATQERINLLLRLDYETFVHSAFLQQGKADAFTTKTPKERKQILSDILGLAQWEQYEEATKEHLRQISAQIDVYALRIREMDDELAKEPGLRHEQSEAERVQAEAQAALGAAEIQLKEVEQVPDDLDRARVEWAAADRRARQRQGDIEAAEKDSARHRERIAGYQALIDARADIESGYATLQAARDADHDLAEKLLQLSNFDTRRAGLEKQIREAQAELENEASGCRARIGELERGLSDSAAADLAAVQAEVMALQALETERQQLQTHLIHLGEERADLDATNRALRVDMFNIKDRLDKLEKVATAICPLCGQPLDEQHRRELVEQLSVEGKQYGDTYRTHETRMKSITDETSAHKQRTAEIDLDLRRLQPMIERAGVLQAQADRASEAEARLQEERANLQALEALLASGDFAQEIREQLAALEAERDAIGYDRESHEAARAQLSTYQAYERRQFDLENALTALPGAEADLQAAAARRDRSQTALVEEQQNMADLKTDIERLEALKAEYDSRQQLVAQLRTSANSAHERLVSARQAIAALESQRQRKADLEQRAEEARHEKGLYEDLRLAFGKNGIPAMIIETAIPELEAAANELLRRMTEGRMALNFSTQREKKTGGMAETLDIQVADELGTRDYELYSGGEAFRIDFAIRVALSQMLARRAGAHLRTLFVDEGFGTQDADGRDRLVEAITAIQGDFDLILVITHIDELRDHFPVHLVVEKLPGGSRIVVR